MSSHPSLHIRLFILIKRMRIILDVMELKKIQFNMTEEMPEFVDGIISLIDTIHNYVTTQELSNDMLDYGYNGVMYTEKIMNLLDSLNIQTNKKNKKDKNYKNTIELLEQCRLKFE
jgi:hypothetical protein